MSDRSHCQKGNKMKTDETKKRIIQEKKFVLEEIGYIARLYKNYNGRTYGEIVYQTDGQRPKNMRGVARTYLARHEIVVPTNDKSMVTHKAVKKLIETLDEASKSQEAP